MDEHRPTDDVYTALLARFRRNLEAVVRAAQAAGATVTIVPAPPHLGYAPFYTAYGPHLSPHQIRELTTATQNGEAALRKGDLDGAASEARTAVRLDPFSAAAWHLLGRALDARGEHAEATDALVHASALDISRKRSQPAFSDVAREVCRELGCTTADAHSALVSEARQRGLAAYTDRFGDHEHLHPDGNDWVAGLMADLLLADGMEGG
jgi:tetratricopeptide (TPR) repeat protein